MHRLVLAAGATVTLLSLAACGSGGTASSGTSSGTGAGQPSGGPGGPGGPRVPRGAAGELAQVNGSTLILDTQAGDVSVTYGPSTTITRTRTGALADIVTGSCIVALGQKDTSGTLTAASVRLSQPVNGACPAGPGNRPPGNGGAPRRTPAPGQPALAAAA